MKVGGFLLGKMNLSWQGSGTMFHVEHSFMVGRCQIKLFFREKEFKKSIK